MVRRLLLPLAWAVAALAEEPPTVETEGSDTVLVNETDFTKFVATGGRTDAPAGLGTAPWIRTGGRQYIWHLNVTEPVEGGLQNPHPLDGTVTACDTLMVPQDKAGSYTVSVSLQEEWQDSGNPQLTLFWPLPKGVSMPSLDPTPQAPPVPWCPALPLVPPSPP